MAKPKNDITYEKNDDAIEEVEYSLENLENDIAGYQSNTNKLPRSKHIIVKLPTD